MLSKSSILFIVVLLIITLLLTYIISSIILSHNLATLPFTSSQAIPTLTQQEKSVIIFPAANASQSVKDAHFQLVLKAAKEGHLNISHCIPTPRVLRVKRGSFITVDNPDARDHTIIINKYISYKIASRGSQSIPITASVGSGLYTYTCDQAVQPTGIFAVE